MRIAYVQTLDELAFNERIDGTRMRAEVAQTADTLNCPALLNVADEFADDLDSPALLPGNVVWWEAFGIQPSLIVLEIRSPELHRGKWLSAYQRLCARYSCELVLLEGRWKTGADSLYERKAQFEVEMMAQFKRHHIDLVMLDRFMFLVGILNHSSSPLSNRLVNSHPGPITGSTAVPGASPIADTVSRHRCESITETSVTAHKVSYVVDGGEELAVTKIPLKKNESELSLRTRIYSGYEAQNQSIALSSQSELGPLRWPNALPRFPEPNRYYRKITK